MDLIPNNKILWGGDCATVEEIYGALYFAKDIVAAVLADWILRKKISLNNAEYITGNIFRSNAKELYNI